MERDGRNLKLVAALAVGILLGMIGMFTFSGGFQSPRLPDTSPNAVQAPPLLVARHDIENYTVLADPDKLFETRPAFKDFLPPGAIQDREKLRGRRLLRGLSQGQFVTEKDLGPPPDKEPKTKLIVEDVLVLAVSDTKDDKMPKLEPGQRALAIKVDVLAIKGFVLPGSRVDVIRTPARDLEKPLLVTLSVTAEQATILTTAQSEANLMLVLRKAD